MPEQSRSAARPEIFFAFVRPTGCQAADVIAALRAELSRVAYSVAPVIKVSGLLHSFANYAHLSTFEGPEDARIEAHMNAGDELRKQFDDPGLLGYLAAEAIATERLGKVDGTAWIIDSLKHKREVEVLRETYGEYVFVISIYADEDDRIRSLSRDIARYRGTHEGADDTARKLIKRDQEGSETNKFGQDVRTTFPLADYFISTTQDIRRQVGRMIETLFGRPTRSPSQDEYAMSVARSAALRSADLSRQVGAVIVDRDGEVVVAGCNEVPKPGGGVYWEGDSPDKRDFTLGFDPNEATSRDMLIELFRRIGEQGWLSRSASKQGPTSLAKRAMNEKVLERARVTSLVEFGRIVHAEMNAVLRAASSGISVRGMRMICTTFPCHVCARHLLGSGLSEVVYIEPYPKSLASVQYPDAISVGEKDAPGMLRFRPFMGWSHLRYARIFEFGKRKDDTGYLQIWDAHHAQPKVAGIPDAHRNIEEGLAAKMKELLATLGISRTSNKRVRRNDGKASKAKQ
jgi:cytidine deaminase